MEEELMTVNQIATCFDKLSLIDFPELNVFIMSEMFVFENNEFFRSEFPNLITHL